MTNKRHAGGIASAVQNFNRIQAEAAKWEEADELTIARAEVLSLIGLLAELDRMEAGNADDALGGYCGAKVSDFKRRYREAIARNGDTPEGGA